MALKCNALELWIVLSFCFCCATSGDRQVVVSHRRLTALSKFEVIVTTVARATSALPHQFVNFVSSVNAEYAAFGDNINAFIRYPINQYRVIRRFSYDWPSWITHLRKHASVSTTITRFLTDYESLSLDHREIDKFSARDLPTAIHGLTLIHIYYREKAKLLPCGDLCQHPTLTIFELLQLAAVTFTYNLDDFSEDSAITWLKLAVDQVIKFRPYGTVADLIDYIIRHKDNYGTPDGSEQSFLRAHELHALRQISKMMVRSKEHMDSLEEVILKDEEVITCRAEVDQYNGGSYCFLFHSPQMLYAPFRYEILSNQPFAAVVHNFMSVSMAQNFVKVSTQLELEVANVLATNGSAEADLITRLSESAALDPSSELSVWFDLRVQHATLLWPNSQIRNVFDGEPAQIINYGVGGFYQEHYDYFHESHKKGPDVKMDTIGDRLATVLVYLTDVEAGGNTAFSEIGVSVVPRAGKALVWFNLDPRNGTHNEMTLHSACPVNIGNKWIVNKWIREHLKTGHFRPVNGYKNENSKIPK